MKVVGIESASLVASVAVVENDSLAAEYTVNFKKTHSQTLLPMVAEVAKMIDLDWDTVDAIAVSGGPGSFTGLRIGSATAKGLGLAKNIPLVHVPTIDAMACNFFGAQHLICPMLDAKRSQVYTGLYHMKETLEVVKEQCAMDVRELLAEINALGEPVIFLGDGVLVSKKVIEEVCQVPYFFAPAAMNRQRAASVAMLGAKMFAEDRFETAAEHAPNYLRVSQAEREMQNKTGITLEEAVEQNQKALGKTERSDECREMLS